MHSERNFRTDQVQYNLSVREGSDTSYAPHCHAMYEIYCFLGGRIEFLLEGKKYIPEPNSVLLIDHSRFHSMRMLDSTVPYRRLVLNFSGSLLRPEEECLLALFRQPAVLYRDAYSPTLLPYFSAIEACANLESPVQNIAIRARIVSLLSALFAMSAQAIGSQSENEAVQPVLDYISAHLTETLRLESLAAQFYMSKNHLTKLFRDATGTTVAAYILYKRMALARVFLRSGHPASVAARECGFEDYSSFYRSYKKIFGCSPREPLRSDSDAPASTLLPDPEAL